MAASKQKNESGEEISFGRQLKALREQSEIDLKSVSADTRIAISSLRLIEAEAFDKLPDEVFVKGFLRAYSEIVGADADRIIQNYLVGRHHYYQRLEYEAGLSKSRRAFRPRLVLCILLLVCTIFAAVTLFRNNHGGDIPGADPSSPEVSPKPAPLQLPETDIQTPAAQEQPREDYRLKINAVEETWLKIIIDNQDPKQYSLNPGDRLELKASTGFNLLIGSATGIHLQLNGQPVVLEGKHGQVISRKLP